MSSATTNGGPSDREHTISVGETAGNSPYTLPVEDVLTGRLFATGKSNTGSVIAEELLNVDTRYSQAMADDW